MSIKLRVFVHFFILVGLLIRVPDSAAANLDTVAQTNVGASSNNIPDNWLERFNYYRQAAGLPSVVESLAYSADLAKHVNYMLLNVPTEGLWHGETPGRPGYTAEGAQAAAESNLFWFPSGVSYTTPAIAIDGWMGSIHHRYGMLNPDLVTTGFGIGCDTQNCGAGLNVIRGLVGGNAPRPDGVIYPGPNQSNVNTDIILTWQFLWEPTVVLKNASLRNSSGQLIPITTTSPPNGDYFNMVSVKPNTVLSPGTTYTASMSVQLGDRQLDQTWIFTTAPLPAPPGAATLVSPSGGIGDTTPTYIWNKVSEATNYVFWLGRINSDNSLTPILEQAFESSAVCDSTTCSITPGVTLSGGNYRWWIQTSNLYGYGPWSSPMNFSLSTIPLPGVATLVSPTGGITDTTPTYTWNKVNAATWYYLWVSQVNSDGSFTTVHSQWYESSAVCSGATCSITPAGVTLSSGNYSWWIQTWNDGGYGPWSTKMDFSLP
jgi:cysteine-rich secretory family protein